MGEIMKIQLFTIALIFLSAVSAQNVEKLKITLFVEALCPDSKHTVTTSFTPAINNGLLDMADVNYYLAGNASDDGYVRGSGKYSFKCQHDEIECGSNIDENCMLHHAPDRKTALLSIGCMFTEIMRHSTATETNDAFLKCTTQYYKTDFRTMVNIQKCKGSNIKEGLDLFDDAIKATPKDHTFIPWATVDGVTLTQKDRDAINNN